MSCSHVQHDQLFKLCSHQEAAQLLWYHVLSSLMKVEAVKTRNDSCHENLGVLLAKLVEA